MQSLLNLLLAPFLFIWSLLIGGAANNNKAAQQKAQQSKKNSKKSKSAEHASSSQSEAAPAAFTSSDEPNGKNMQTFLRVVDQDPEGTWKQNLASKKASTKVEIPRGYGKKVVEDRWDLILGKNDKYQEYLKQQRQEGAGEPLDIKKEIFDDVTKSRAESFKDNVENFVGTVKVPLGIAGPLRVNGLHAQGDFYVPLATTEAALVASISRGISAINQSGGCNAAVILEGVSRDPVFQFSSIVEVGQFVSWSTKQHHIYKKEAEKSTRFGKLVDVKYTIEGVDVHIRFVYTSGDASGQNMVTIATENILNYIMKNIPVKPKMALIEGGMSGDKKGNSGVFTSVRGKRVIAEVTIPKHVIQGTLHCAPQDFVRSAGIGTRGMNLIGILGPNLHFANAITALAIALGQDPACTAESHAGIGRCELTENGDVYICVTLPNLLVASVGGGTKLPSQRACLELMGMFGAGKANALAEIFAAVCIAGELSLGAAVISGDFARAHKLLARDTSIPIDLKKDTLEEAFDKAQGMVVKLGDIPPKEIILDIYGLYKQSTVGDVNISKPSLVSLDLKARAKYDAWANKQGISKKDAMKQYIDIVVNLVEEQKKAQK